MYIYRTVRMYVYIGGICISCILTLPLFHAQIHMRKFDSLIGEIRLNS